MAIDAYLQIDGIKGESSDSGHSGWIKITSAHWEVVKPRSSSVSTAGGHTAGHGRTRRAPYAVAGQTGRYRLPGPDAELRDG